MRYWYSAHGFQAWDCGWCFGDTPEQARAAAIAEIKQRSPRTRGNGILSLQSSPNYGDDTPTAYFNAPLTLP